MGAPADSSRRTSLVVGPAEVPVLGVWKPPRDSGAQRVQFSQLKPPRTSQSRDTPSLLCPVHIPDPLNHKWLCFIPRSFGSIVYCYAAEKNPECYLSK